MIGMLSDHTELFKQFSDNPASRSGWVVACDLPLPCRVLVFG
jgi:hypothetical protein